MWGGFILVSSSWPGFPVMLVRKDGLFEEMTHPSNLKPHSERQEMLSKGVSLFPGKEICTFKKKQSPNSQIAQIKSHLSCMSAWTETVESLAKADTSNWFDTHEPCIGSVLLPLV